MSVFGPLKQTTVTVARLSSISKTTGDPSYGSQSSIDVHNHGGSDVVRDSDGQVTDVTTKLTTDEWEFELTDAVWLPGANTSNVSEAINPESVGKDSAAGITVYWAEF